MPSSRETTAVDNLGVPTLGGDPAASGHIPIGSVIAGRYRLLETIGGGGMGVVYRARDLDLGEDLAVKSLAPRLAGDPYRVEGFREEIRLARKITHANVCRVHDLVAADDHVLITMELIDGETLSARLARTGAMSAAEALPILRDVAAGLAAAHAEGVIHRDLKPSNIMIRRSGQAVLTDFGVAVRGGDPDVDIAGTRGYMAPEQLAGAQVSPRTDVYALGVLAYRMLAGELPGGPTAVTHTAEISGDHEPGPTDLPGPLGPFIAACTSLAPAARPADGTAAWEMLAAIQPGRRRRRRWPLLALAAIAVAVAVAVAVLSASPSYQEHPAIECHGFQKIEVSGVFIDSDDVAVRTSSLCSVTLRDSRVRGGAIGIRASGSSSVTLVNTAVEGPTAIRAAGAATVTVDPKSKIDGKLDISGVAELRR